MRAAKRRVCCCVLSFAPAVFLLNAEPVRADGGFGDPKMTIAVDYATGNKTAAASATETLTVTDANGNPINLKALSGGEAAAGPDIGSKAATSSTTTTRTTGANTKAVESSVSFSTGFAKGGNSLTKSQVHHRNGRFGQWQDPCRGERSRHRRRPEYAVRLQRRSRRGSECDWKRRCKGRGDGVEAAIPLTFGQRQNGWANSGSASFRGSLDRQMRPFSQCVRCVMRSSLVLMLCTATAASIASQSAIAESAANGPSNQKTQEANVKLAAAPAPRMPRSLRVHPRTRR